MIKKIFRQFKDKGIRTFDIEINSAGIFARVIFSRADICSSVAHLC